MQGLNTILATAIALKLQSDNAATKQRAQPQWPIQPILQHPMQINIKEMLQMLGSGRKTNKGPF